MTTPGSPGTPGWYQLRAHTAGTPEYDTARGPGRRLSDQPAQQASAFSAVAYSPSRNQWAWSWGWPDKDGAEQQAKERTGSAYDAEIRMSARDAYTAVVVGDSPRSWAISSRSNFGDALLGAIRATRKQVANYHLLVLFHSTNGEFYLDGAPTTPAR